MAGRCPAVKSADVVAREGLQRGGGSRGERFADACFDERDRFWVAPFWSREALRMGKNHS